MTGKMCTRKLVISAFLGAIALMLPRTDYAQPVTFAKNSLVYNILDHGALNNAAINSQQAIQKAIDACAEAGGGTVLIPAGNFSTATIRLKSNINLHLANGARLYAIPDSTLYKNDKEGLEDAGETFIPSLIVAKKLKNISITGQGSIIGQPEFYFTEITGNDTYPGWNENARKYGADMARPWVKNPKISLIYISDCEGLLIRDVSIINSPNWSCHIQWSRDINIQGITILSSLKQGVNSDGLDIDGCKNVLISDCIIRTGDDAICLKTTRQGNRSETCEDITVTNCTLSSSSCALKIGTETYSDFNRISFTNCTISNSNRGIGIIVRDGAIVNQVTFSNILLDCMRKPVYWWGNGEAFHFNVIKRNKDSKVGRIQNVRLQGISGNVQGTSSIIGFAAKNDSAYSSISTVELFGINLKMHPEAEKDKRTTYGIEVINAMEIDITQVNLKWQETGAEKKWKNSLYMSHVKNFEIHKFKSTKTASNSNTETMLLHNTRNGWLDFRAADLSPANYCRITGKQTSDINIFSEKSDKNKINIAPEAESEVILID